MCSSDLVAIAAIVFAVLATPLMAEAPALPADAVQLKGKEIAAYLHGKRFSTTIYDGPELIKATVNWDFNANRVFGDFSVNGTKRKFDNPATVKGDTSCGEKSADGTWVCQRVFVKGNMMYEVNKAGQIHAVSKLK